ncbi:cupin domain-containing protein [Chelatococcus asaccharovorans]|uniref:cupin domain-containing protein n=1 Tax=Chelatococcus asaccharovorans TaxID=28210 RepID=UPI00224C6BAA|nr:cupin domain-containing protein [Chelatococcus asaccharovorans]CAH1672194.1 Oxalate decarboxylase [Chelatococcus asaccharovorans]CAH1676400.1 Oxalate decarboxylase [Chelatococcus asaccharovorans]
MHASTHKTSLSNGRVVHASDLGRVTQVKADDLRIMKGLSIKKLTLAPGAIRAPHWHANCVELGYCLTGEALVTVLGTRDFYSVFTITAGQMFHIPSGALHCIENIGAAQAEFIIAFRHERPEDFSLQGTFGAMSDATLGNAYGLPASAFAPMERTTEGAYLVKRQGAPAIPADAGREAAHKFDIEAQPAMLHPSYGTARLGRAQFWPALTDIAMYSLHVTRDGMREPHWHPETAEMGYVHTGHARMTILNPDASTDSWDLAPGDVYFIPRAYPHHIEVLGADEMHFLIFFDQPMPGDIGIRTVPAAFAPGVMAAALGISQDQLPAFPHIVADPLIVARVNPQST